MKSSPRPQSATSLPRAPRDDAHTRQRKYFIMMSVRVACFILMVAVTPYGWYTWIFALGAAVLPYLAVVVANVGARGGEPERISPDRALDPTRAAAPERVIRVDETHPRPPAAS